MPNDGITTRLHPKLKAALEGFWRDRGETPSAGLRHVAEEWWTLQHLPRLHFRDGVSGRRASLRQGPDVWELVMVARDYGFDPTDLADDPWTVESTSGPEWHFYVPQEITDRLNAHFGGAVHHEDMRQGLLYAGFFPKTVSREIEANARAARALGRAIAAAL
jgi:hypothetical protein